MNENKGKSLSLSHLAEQMLARVNAGIESSSKVEEAMLALVFAQDSSIGKDPKFLLELARYYRSNTNQEIRMVLEVASLASPKGHNALPADESRPFPVTGPLSGLTAAEREELRVGGNNGV